MRIDTITPDRLTVINRPWLLLVLSTILGVSPIFGALIDPDISFVMRTFLASLGGVISWVVWRYMPMTTLTFDRTESQVILTHHRITGNTTQHFDLATIQGAMHQSHWSDGTRLERLALKTADGPIPVEFGYFSGSRRPVVKEINDWLTTA